MPNCDCSSRCNCVIKAGTNVTVDGSGSPGNPYIVSAADSGGGGEAVTGAIIMFGGAVAPTGWLLSDGSAVSRTTYAALFAIIGIAYGNGDGTTTFNLPDLAGRFALGADGSHARGTFGGAFNITLGLNQLPVHTHTMAHSHTMNHTHPDSLTVVNTGNHNHQLSFQYLDDTSNTNGGRIRVTDIANQTGGGGTAKSANTSGTGAHQHTVRIPAYSGSTGGSSASDTGPVGGGLPVPTTPPYTAVNFIIKT